MTDVLAGTVADTARLCERILAEVERIIVGKRDATTTVLLGVLASGHILIEDLPGLGKTLLARTFATVLGLEFTRVQFTPDMLPADLTGAMVLDLTHRRGSSGPARCSPACCSPTRSTAPRPRPRPRCSRPWPRARSVSRRHHPLPSRSWCWPPTTPSSTRAPTRCPRPSSTGSSPGSPRATSTRRRGRDGPPPAGPRPVPPVPPEVTDAGRLLAMRESLESVQLDPDLLGTWSPWSPPPAATRRSPWAPRRAGRWPWSSSPAAHAVLDGREYVMPEDIKAVAVAGPRAPPGPPPGDVGPPGHRPGRRGEVLGSVPVRGTPVTEPPAARPSAPAARPPSAPAARPPSAPAAGPPPAPPVRWYPTARSGGWPPRRCSPWPPRCSPATPC